MNKNINTKKGGIARTIIFKSGKLFKAVCLDFDIIEEANTRSEVEIQIKEAVIGYIENVCKNNLDDSLLNRHADKKYWDLYNKYLKVIKNNKIEKNTSDINNTSIFTIPINSEITCYA